MEVSGSAFIPPPPLGRERRSGRVVAYHASTPQTDHLIGTSAHAFQRPMVTHAGMGTHLHTSALGAAIAGNSSGMRFLECPSEDTPFLPEPLLLRENEFFLSKI
ncbi:hypothetical protein TNCV_2616771 [Trichonephila clavipes]|nr:hypothetical protein TNCV_2616771 [Trichonephila clavipes]